VAIPHSSPVQTALHIACVSAITLFVCMLTANATFVLLFFHVSTVHTTDWCDISLIKGNLHLPGPHIQNLIFRNFLKYLYSTHVLFLKCSVFIKFECLYSFFLRFLLQMIEVKSKIKS